MDEHHAAMHEGSAIAPKKKRELAALEKQIVAIRNDEHPDVDPQQECHGRGCKKQIDIKLDAHWLVPITAMRLFDPEAPKDQRNRWEYPPNLGDLILCPGCGEGLLERLREQHVETVTESLEESVD